MVPIDACPWAQIDTLAPTTRASRGELVMSSHSDQDIHAIVLAGELDVDSSAASNASRLRAQRTDAQINVVDLTHLTSVNPTAIKLLLAASSAFCGYSCAADRPSPIGTAQPARADARSLERLVRWAPHEGPRLRSRRR